MTLRELFLGLPRASSWLLAAVLLAAPLLGLLLYRLDRARARRRAALVGPRVRVLASELSRSRRRLRRRLLVGAFFLALVALLQPAWGRAQEMQAPRGADVVIALDVSRSMRASDLPPSRLARAHAAIRELADFVQGEGRGGRLGLIAFAGEARWIAPLTHDLAAFLELAGQVDELSVPRGGSDLGAALALALAAIPAEGPAPAILLLADGEDFGRRGRELAEQCRQRRVRVHAVGFGTARGGKIPLDDGASFLRDRAGQEVVTVLDAANLRALAATTGGEFVDAGATARPLVGLYEHTLVAGPLEASAESGRRERPQRYQWPLLLAFLLFTLELGMHERSRP